ncbi:dTMP kinase [Ectobacillus ponti]|uniref:Thymidylate kinase n=1 Tax=Ectobacillus ponti TaxID=2961894 RepID=A0AA41XCJ8_9BACI|nr:AAA family ATPase [Ectobacillus ponti]MCP8970940.1 AAA family ATPase [Ectobacillus ponti]
MGHFIVIEGVDGTGKSTTAHLLAAKLGAVYYQTPPAMFKEVRSVFRNMDNAWGNFYFYLSTLAVAAREIQTLLSNSDVICDRYSFSTQAYHEISLQQSLHTSISHLDLLKPDLTVLLRADRVIRHERLIQRSSAHSFELDIDYQEQVQARMIRLLEEESTHFLTLDTGAATVEEIVQQILGKLNSLQLESSLSR